MAVQVLCLLQQDIVEDPGDVDGDVVLYGLQHCHVGPDAGQQLTGLGYLLSSLVVHGHPHYGPGDRGTVRDSRKKCHDGGHFRKSVFTDLTNKYTQTGKSFDLIKICALHLSLS